MSEGRRSRKNKNYDIIGNMEEDMEVGMTVGMRG